MATRNNLLVNAFANDADWRVWCQDFHGSLVQAGWVQTADTGQINLATAVRPAASAFAGYEVWRMDDALQATHPIHMKVEYGVGTGQASPGLAVQIGPDGSNGAGTLIGLGTSQRRAVIPSTAVAQSRNFMSGDKGRFYWLGPTDTAVETRNIYIVVERLKSGAGESVGDGVLFGVGGGSGFYQEQIVRHGGVAATAAVVALVADLTKSTVVTNVGQDLALAPYFAVVGKWRYLWRVSYKTVDLATLTPFTMDYLGAVHAFLPIQLGPTWSGNAALGVAVLWE